MSQQHYYEAKVFLSAYNDALRTLDDIAASRAQVQKLKAFERFLLTSAKKGQIHVQGGNIREGTYFAESKISKLGHFSNKLFSQKFPTFDSIKSAGDLSKVLESYL